ncbi:hypothetical protein ABBQ32_006931 [Trebouxia sp. C0010 RCD-2024]
MLRAEDEDLSLGLLVSGTGAAAAVQNTTVQSKVSQATPAPSHRQLRQTRSQTRHSDVGSVDQPDPKATQAAEGQLEGLPHPSLVSGVPPGPSLPEPAAMETVSAPDDGGDVDIGGDVSVGGDVDIGGDVDMRGDVDIGGNFTAAAEGLPELPSSSAKPTEATGAAAPAPAKAEEAAEAAAPAPVTAPEAMEAATQAPAKEPDSAVGHEQPAPSRGRGSRGRRGGRGGRGRGRSKPKGRAKAADNSSPRAPSEQDQADFADQLESPSRADADPGDAAAHTDQADDRDVSISDMTDQQQPKQPQKRSSLRKGKSDASQASEQLTSARSGASKAGESHTPALDQPKAPLVQTSRAPDAEETKEPGSVRAARADSGEVKGHKPKEARAVPQKETDAAAAAAAAADEPPTKRARRAVSGAAQRAAENGKAKGRKAQARRGVVESDSNEESEDVDILDVEDGRTAPVAESGDDAAARGLDARQQAQAGRKRGRTTEDPPARKGRPKPSPAAAKGPAPVPAAAAAAKAGKGAAEGSGPSATAANSGKGSMAAPPAAKEKRTSSGQQDTSEPPAKTAPGDPRQAAEFHKRLLDDAMKQFDAARAMFEEAQSALAQATGQVVSRLGDIDQIHGLTRSILADTNLGKAVNRLARLGNTKPSIAACEQIASKARSSHYLHNSLPLSQHRPDLCDAHASTQGAEGHD